ncbi:MAG: nucleotidyltransferase domain-containing protein [Candidatus Binatia bacterium]
MNHLALHGTDRADVSLLQECKSAVRRVAPDARVILYGSRARGDPEPLSDYDVLILIEGEVQPGLEDRIGDALYEVELEHGVIISEIVLSRQRWDEPRYQALPLHQNVDRHGVLL